MWDGVFYKKLSNYLQVSDWEIRTIIEFIEYENKYGRKCTIECEDDSILNLINEKDQPLEEYTEFVRREYGTGGIGGTEYSVWYDELGIQIAVAEAYQEDRDVMRYQMIPKGIQAVKGIVTSFSNDRNNDKEKKGHFHPAKFPFAPI